MTLHMQNGQIWIAIILIATEPTSAQIGGSARGYWPICHLVSVPAIV
jgi:hypothetical protein